VCWHGQKGRYLVVSSASFGLTQTVLFLGQVAGHLRPVGANLLAWTIGTCFCYSANRRWVWRRTERSRFVSQIVPFWAYGAVGLAFTSASLAVAQRRIHWSHINGALVINGVAILTAILVWIGRYLLLDSLLFSGREEGTASERLRGPPNEE
jgi:putative flippase GtrA